MTRERSARHQSLSLRLSGAVVGVVLALLSGLLALVSASSAEAATQTLCYGYRGCANEGMSNYGYAANSGRMYWRMYSGHNCTNYVAYRMVRAGMPNTRPWSGGGNAHYWGIELANKTDQTPRVGAVAWWRRYDGVGSSGHVAVVEKVLSPTSIIISQDSWGGDFSWKRIDKADGGWPTGFIHLVDKVVANVTPAAIVGTPQVGRALVARPGTWNPGGTAKSFRWFVGGEAVAGATTRAFTPRPGDIGKTVQVRVTARKDGFTAGVSRSSLTAPVAKGTFAVTSPTALTGEARVGETLTATPARFSPAPETANIQWRADGQLIKGQRSTTLTLTPAMVGKNIIAKTIARRAGFTALGADSAPVGPVTAGLVRPTQRFEIKGKPRLGWKLRVVGGSLTPSDARAGYQWYRDGQAVPGATRPEYVVRNADLGKRITVRAAAMKPMWDSWIQRLSAGTAKTFAKLNVRAVGGDHTVRVTLRAWAKGGFKPWGEAKVRVGKEKATVELKKGVGTVVLRGIKPGERVVWTKLMSDDRYLRRRESTKVTVTR